MAPEAPATVDATRQVPVGEHEFREAITQP